MSSSAKSEGQQTNGRFKKKAAAVLSGSASGAVVSLSLQPLDVIRTKLQAQAATGTQGLTSSAVLTARDIWAAGGVRNFWRGSGPTVWRLSVGLGIQFLALETIKDALLNARLSRSDSQMENLLGSDNLQLTSLEAFFTGGLARGMAAAATVPFTIAKTRMEYSVPAQTAYKGTFSTLRSIAQQEGLAGIYRGIGPTILTNAPFSALYYMFYTGLKQRLQSDDKPSALVNFTSGTVAAVAATLLTQPTDMIRTQMQLGLAGNAGKGAVATLRAILIRGGPNALMAGAGPRILKRTLQSALVWTLYEELQPRLTRYAEQFRGGPPFLK